MDTLNQWLELAKNLGIGATFVLGIVAFVIWRKLDAETSYSRQRDRETLEVLSAVTKLLESVQEIGKTNTVVLTTAIHQLQTVITGHLERIERKLKA